MAKINPIYGVLILGALIFFQNSENAPGTQSLAPVDSAIVTRTIDGSGLVAGDTFTVDYKVSDVGAGSWGVLIEDIVTGGCSLSDGGSTFREGWLSPILTRTATYTTPSSAATCTFSGTYEFSESTQKSITGDTSISANDCNSLKITALDAIVSWKNNPSTANKQLALDGISGWAGVC